MFTGEILKFRSIEECYRYLGLTFSRRFEMSDPDNYLWPEGYQMKWLDDESEWKWPEKRIFFSKSQPLIVRDLKTSKEQIFDSVNEFCRQTNNDPVVIKSYIASKIGRASCRERV